MKLINNEFIENVTKMIASRVEDDRKVAIQLLKQEQLFLLKLNNTQKIIAGIICLVIAVTGILSIVKPDVVNYIVVMKIILIVSCIIYACRYFFSID